jgi:hypothetical protein
MDLVKYQSTSSKAKMSGEGELLVYHKLICNDTVREGDHHTSELEERGELPWSSNQNDLP